MRSNAAKCQPQPWQRTGADRQAQSINAGGHVTRQEFDPRGNPLKITDPDGYNLGFEYHAMAARS